MNILLIIGLLVVIVLVLIWMIKNPSIDHEVYEEDDQAEIDKLEKELDHDIL